MCRLTQCACCVWAGLLHNFLGLEHAVWLYGYSKDKKNLHSRNLSGAMQENEPSWVVSVWVGGCQTSIEHPLRIQKVRRHMMNRTTALIGVRKRAAFLLYLPHWTVTLLLSTSRKSGEGQKEGRKEGGWWGRGRRKQNSLTCWGRATPSRNPRLLK